MPNVTITIPQPVLTAGQSFKTRYRLLPSGSWSGYTSRSNAAFTLTGLATGDYQLEVILVKADSSECPAIYKTFTVVPEYSCISFGSQIVKTGTLYYLQITYTLPGGFTNPACGWDITYVQNGITTTNTYTTLPTSGIIKIPVTNTAMAVYVRANMCNGNKKDCHQADVSPVAPPPCTGLNLVAQTLVKSGSSFFINLTFVQSSPATTSLQVVYSQTGSFIAPGDGGSVTVPLLPTATSVSIPVKPARPNFAEFVYYTGKVIDACNNQIPISVNTFYY